MSEKRKDALVRVEQTRGRISLGSVVPDLAPGQMFRVNVEADGLIVLTPVKAVPINPKEEGDGP